MPQKIGWTLDHFLFCGGNPVQHDECCATGYGIGDARLPQQKRRARATQCRCVFGVCFPTGLGLLSKQPDIQTTFLLSNSLPKIDFSRLCVSTTPQPQPACYKPKEKIYLFNSVLTL